LLIARIRAVLRRASQDEMDMAAPNIIRQGELLMDPDRHLCSWKGEEVKLTVTEFLILQALASRPGMVKNRDQLMDAAYGESVFLDDRTIDSHIKRLRRKIRAQDSTFDNIETLYGIGYKYRS
jgi:two-component system response regulator ChvI